MFCPRSLYHVGISDTVKLVVQPGGSHRLTVNDCTFIPCLLRHWRAIRITLALEMTLKSDNCDNFRQHAPTADTACQLCTWVVTVSVKPPE